MTVGLGWDEREVVRVGNLLRSVDGEASIMHRFQQTKRQFAQTYLHMTMQIPFANNAKAACVTPGITTVRLQACDPFALSCNLHEAQ